MDIKTITIAEKNLYNFITSTLKQFYDKYNAHTIPMNIYDLSEKNLLYIVSCENMFIEMYEYNHLWLCNILFMFECFTYCVDHSLSDKERNKYLKFILYGITYNYFVERHFLGMVNNRNYASIFAVLRHTESLFFQSIEQFANILEQYLDIIPEGLEILVGRSDTYFGNEYSFKDYRKASTEAFFTKYLENSSFDEYLILDDFYNKLQNY